MPADWRPTPAQVAFADKRGLDLPLEVSKFKLHYDGKTTASWAGRFTSWLKQSASWSVERDAGKASKAEAEQHKQAAAVLPFKVG
jgi:hypothetical protein